MSDFLFFPSSRLQEARQGKVKWGFRVAKLGNSPLLCFLGVDARPAVAAPGLLGPSVRCLFVGSGAESECCQS